MAATYGVRASLFLSCFFYFSDKNGTYKLSLSGHSWKKGTFRNQWQSLINSRRSVSQRLHSFSLSFVTNFHPGTLLLHGLLLLSSRPHPTQYGGLLLHPFPGRCLQFPSDPVPSPHGGGRVPDELPEREGLPILLIIT